MKYSMIKDLSTDELNEKLTLEREKLTRLKINHSISPIENPKAMGASRKNVARMLTELRSRALAAKNAK